MIKIPIDLTVELRSADGTSTGYYQTSQINMTTPLIAILIVVTLLYAMLWHNQPAHPQRDKKTATEAVFDFLLDFYLPTKLWTLFIGFGIEKLITIVTGLKSLRQRMSSRSTSRWLVGEKLKQKIFVSRRIETTHQTIK